MIIIYDNNRLVPSHHNVAKGANSLEHKERYDIIITDEEWYIFCWPRGVFFAGYRSFFLVPSRHTVQHGN